MALILNIETATQVCSVGLSNGKEMLSIRESHEKNIHASKVTVFTEEVLKEAGKEMKDLDAVAVSMGPGSYTGLRIGVSAAKGFCYALDIPLIAIPTLQSMALGAMLFVDEKNALLCPMIDARRMEVYTALFDHHNGEVKKTEALIVDGDSFDAELAANTIYFFGDGAEMCRETLDPKGMIFIDDVHPSAKSLAQIAAQKYEAESFENLAYFEPYYLKDFIAGIPNVKGLR
jgi:tRNA threonylcarbamoyladenosine biosynthesis protein TsaB